MHALFQKIVKGFIRRVVARHYVAITVVSLLVTAGSVAAIATSWNIDSDLSAMLPSDSETSRAMREADERLGSTTALFVVIDSPNTEANKKFAAEFAEHLEELDAVSQAHFHNDKSFFRRNQLLYVPSEDLAKLRERLSGEIKNAKKRANPLFVSLDDEEDEGTSSEDSFDLDKLREKYNHLHDRHKEYLISDDGYSLTIVVRFNNTASDLEATRDLLDRIETLGQDLEPAEYHPQMTIDYGGGLVSRQQEYESILDDVQTSALATLVALFLVIALYFRRFRAVAMVLAPLVMGVVWTLAIGFAVFGELTTVSAFIFAILLGLGIDFSIHLLNGYDHKRREDLDSVEALAESFAGTGRATFIGGLTTLMTFLVISIAEFEGLSQFGQLASLGIVSTLAAMFVVLPALILTFQRILPHDPAVRDEADDEPLPPSTFERLTPALLVVIAAATVASVYQFDDLEFQNNFRKIGEIAWPWKTDGSETDDPDPQRDAEKAGQSRGEAVGKRAVAVRKQIDPDSFKPPRRQTSTPEKYASALKGQRSSIPTILLFDDPEEARRVSRYMSERKAQGELDTIATISSIYDFLPGSKEEQRRRLEDIRGIGKLLEREDLGVLDDKKRELAETLASQTDVDDVISIRDLPTWVKRLFEENGPQAKPASEGEAFAYEYMIYLVVRIDQNDGTESRRLLRQIEEVREETGVSFRIASQASILVSLLDEIQGEGAMLIAIALGLVFLFLILVFGHPLRGLLAITPLAFGSIWMLGLMGWLGIRFDFFNVIIIPVVIGIGVDDGVHFYRYYLDAGPGSIRKTFRHVGWAIFMTSLTSSIGFGGLAVTTQQGLQSIGYVAITGIMSTFVASVLVMPPLLSLAERTGWDSITADE